MSPVWNPHAIDYSAGVYEKDGQAWPNKIGCWVMTTEEGWEALRRQNEHAE